MVTDLTEMCHMADVEDFVSFYRLTLQSLISMLDAAI